METETVGQVKPGKINNLVDKVEAEIEFHREMIKKCKKRKEKLLEMED